MTLAEYNELKSGIENARQEESRAEGAIAQIKKGLREKFKATNVEQARKMLAKLDEGIKAKGKELERAAGEWREKWGGKL